MKKLSDESYISLICNGEFDAIPGFPIGELFESFFDNINYNLIVEEENVFVDFTGDAICDDEPCTILIEFKINETADGFEIVEVDVDEDVLDEQEVLDLVEDIAYVAGATIDDSCYECSHDCSHCHEDCEYDEEDDLEGYDYEESEDNDNEDDSNEEDDDKK
jgi:hypothetical protein